MATSLGGCQLLARLVVLSKGHDMNVNLPLLTPLSQDFLLLNLHVGLLTFTAASSLCLKEAFVSVLAQADAPP